MKKIWFQFVRKELETEGATTREPSEPKEQGSSERASSPSVPSREERTLRLRMVGDVWIFPNGEYRPVVLTGSLRELGDSERTVRLFPLGLNLDIGEMRRLDGSLTRMREDRFDVMEIDHPMQLRVRRRTAIASLRVGELITELGDLDGAPTSETGEEPYARGTGVFRLTQLEGHLFAEPFRCRILEMVHVHLIQGSVGWRAHLYQLVPDEVRGQAGQAVVRQLRSAGTTTDLLGILRRACERYARSGLAHRASPSPEERHDVPSQKV